MTVNPHTHSHSHSHSHSHAHSHAQSHTHSHQHPYLHSIDALRVVLAFFVCVVANGFPVGSYVQSIAGFAAIAFYILSGYLSLRKSKNFEKHLRGAIRRTAIMFFAMLAVYLIANIFYLRSMGESIFAYLNTKKIWIEFLFFNVWPLPLGGSIWFIHALLYAYLFVFALHKMNLMKYGWVDVALCGSLLIISILTGECADLVHVNLPGRSCMAGDFLTGALPYLMLGRIIFRKQKLLCKIHRYQYCAIALAGILLSILELRFLLHTDGSVYTGHLLGNAILASAVCLLAIKQPSLGRKWKLLTHAGTLAKLVYLLQDLLAYLLGVALFALSPFTAEAITPWTSVLVFALCCAMTALLCLFKKQKPDPSHPPKETHTEAKTP